MAKAPKAPYRRTIFILFDGARPDVFQRLLDAGELPMIARRLTPEGCVRTAVSSFPTVSGPAHLPFMTGCFPGTLNVPGIYWFDRVAFGRSRTGLDGPRTYLAPFRVAKMNRDVTPGVPTIAVIWPDALYISAWFNRGSPPASILTRWTKAASFVRGLLTKNWLRCDIDAEVKLTEAVDRGVSFIFAVFPSADELGHRFGPLAAEAAASYRQFDMVIGRLFDQLERRGEGESTLVVVSSDHGQSTTHTHFALDRFVSERLGRTMVYKRFAGPLRNVENVVMPSGNGMANVYFRGEGWTSERPSLDAEPYRSLCHDLLAQEPIDILAWRATDGWIEVRSRRGVARLREELGRVLSYKVVTNDPFGYGPLPARASFDEILRQTFGSQYPDAPVSLATFLRAPRSADLVVTAHPGWDLRDWWEYQEPRGTHGALHAEHALVPVLTNAGLMPGPMRTVDLFATMAMLSGRRVPVGVEGRSRAVE